MRNWLTRLRELHDAGEPAVLVTVAAIRGSAPREPGARMIVTREHSFGTVGGGQLEYRCIRQACDQLAEPTAPASRQHRFTLGPDCGQCCGGVVDVWFERVGTEDLAWIDAGIAALGNGDALLRVSLRQSEERISRLVVGGQRVLFAGGEFVQNARYRTAAVELAGRPIGTRVDVLAISDNMRMPVLVDRTRPNAWTIAIFGAGHVGTACAEAMKLLPANVTLFDSRGEQVRAARSRSLATDLCDDPLGVLDRLPAGSDVLIMTHDHGIDFALVERALALERFGYVGLIGSLSKRRRFEKRLRKAGFSDAQLNELVCPIGIDSIRGKKPFEIAIGVSAELVQRREALGVAQANNTTAERGDRHA
ncbi:MAG: xanthine dehydrogenase accessory protein XdhC [Pseudomonadota bacterium]